MKQFLSQNARVAGPVWQKLATGLSAFVSLLAFVAWGGSNGWHLAELSAYGWFPLFGLLAFSLLWAQYVTLAVILWQNVPADALRTYFRTSGYVILIALVTHPSLLVWQLWRDGFGLPPESYLRHFVAPGMEWAALLGSFSLLIFLAYELHRWYGQRSWWRFVFYASDLGMLAIVWHGLALGGELQHGWYRIAWICYTGVFIAALVYLRFGHRETRYH